MAATKLIAMHVNKGKTVAQCLNERLDYTQNPLKTKQGELISSYECEPETAAMEFLLSKREYQRVTGEEYKGNIIAYQIRQSFKPGEITPEEANKLGYETAMRFNQGKTRFYSFHSYGPCSYPLSHHLQFHYTRLYQKIQELLLFRTCAAASQRHHLSGTWIFHY